MLKTVKTWRLYLDNIKLLKLPKMEVRTEWVQNIKLLHLTSWKCHCIIYSIYPQHKRSWQRDELKLNVNCAAHYSRQQCHRIGLSGHSGELIIAVEMFILDMRWEWECHRSYLTNVLSSWVKNNESRNCWLQSFDV